MADVRRIEHEGARVETGPTQFGDDWPGVFIRGDVAAYLATAVRLALTGHGDLLNDSTLQRLAAILESCRVGSPEGGNTHHDMGPGFTHIDSPNCGCRGADDA